MAFPVALGGDAGVLSWFVGGSEDDEFIILNCQGYAAQIEQLLSLSREVSTIRYRPVGSEGSIIESHGALVARVCDKMPSIKHSVSDVQRSGRPSLPIPS